MHNVSASCRSQCNLLRRQEEGVAACIDVTDFRAGRDRARSLGPEPASRTVPKTWHLPLSLSSHRSLYSFSPLNDLCRYLPHAELPCILISTSTKVGLGHNSAIPCRPGAVSTQPASLAPPPSEQTGLGPGAELSPYKHFRCIFSKRKVR